MQKHEAGSQNKSFYLLEDAKSAFDLSSGGIGIHFAAVELLIAGRKLPDWAKNSVNISGSNYLVNPYVFGWKNPDGSYKDFGPKNLSPHSISHLRLLAATKEEYRNLDNLKRKLLEVEEADSKSLSQKQARKAAIYKLGAMLAVTDQLTYDASQQGKPLPANFRPEDLDGKLHANWQRLFGREMPTLRGLY